MTAASPRSLDLERPEWQEHARCRDPRWRGVDFFPGKGESVQPAKRVCRGCPVRDDCLAYALSLPEKDDKGVWGGMSQRDRIEIRRGRARWRRTDA